MAKLRLAIVVSSALVLAVFAASAAADPHAGPPICSHAGKSVSGTHRNLTIRGNAFVRHGRTLRVRGNLTIARGACLDAFTLGTVHVGGNILVSRGATLALGCTPNSIGPVPPCGTHTTNDTVRGSIIANHAMTMYLDGDWIGRNVISHGGGPGLHGPFLNFPVKDNTIGGRLVMTGWRGGWIGAIRNTVAGNLRFSRNASVQDPDSNEVQTNTVGGNLVCWRNSPPTHVNPDDGGLPNTVSGSKIGQCSGL
ncbi:MAG TPA: hypothetical protein VFQ71_07140 [Gaiellales bacterium]|jgi:hypothetical protein|nr:hypothetical protein [Gaiellales bacterium]